MSWRIDPVERAVDTARNLIKGSGSFPWAFLREALMSKMDGRKAGLFLRE
jgi:hypothetical protein